MRLLPNCLCLESMTAERWEPLPPIEAHQGNSSGPADRGVLPNHPLPCNPPNPGGGRRESLSPAHSREIYTSAQSDPDGRKVGGRRKGAKDKRERIVEEKMSASPRARAGREGTRAEASD